MENVGQGNGIIIDLTIPVFGLENKFQCPGIDIFMPETDIFRAILRFGVIFFAVCGFYWYETDIKHLGISSSSLRRRMGGKELLDLIGEMIL
jgi:hypothetical protein